MTDTTTEPARPGRGILFVADETLVRLLDLPRGERITGVAVDFRRLGILLSVEADHLPAVEPGGMPVELLVSADVADTAAKVARLEAENAGLRRKLAAAEDRDDLVPLRLVPVEVFGGHCPGGDTDCESAFGLMDAVQAWSDCNHAEGHIYRVDEAESTRQPGDTVEIYVRRRDLPWFEKRFVG